MPVVPAPVVNAAVSVLKVLTPSTADKKWWQSKTLWTTCIVAGAGFYPPVQALVVANPELAGVVVGGIFAILRVISGGKVTLK